ncbi:unnamed protein product [marine sediment metagenome]|uniref:Uncharacterized protein n=1 Tax=marine sediment metagenome TaxID=412755 RepID=X0X4E8_9ZZZZ
MGLSRSSAEQLLSKAAQHDPDVPAAYAAQDEVSVIPEQTDAGAADTYTLTFDFPVSGLSVTTAAIAYDAVDTVIETAVDVAFTTASYPSWTNADISVSMGGAAGLDDGTVTFTFDGASVTGLACVVDWTATGFTENGSTARTGGQGDRKALAALITLNALAGAVHNIGDPVTEYTKPEPTGQSRPRAGLLRDLGLQVSVEEGSDDVLNRVIVLYPEVANL